MKICKRSLFDGMDMRRQAHNLGINSDNRGETIGRRLKLGNGQTCRLDANVLQMLQLLKVRRIA
jgi:hypothetical protein